MPTHSEPPSSTLHIDPAFIGLNPEQYAAATSPSNRSTLVLAGAGSGKTRVLTSRVTWLIQNYLASPGGILAVTFTNKAAKEMLTRISAQLPINVRGMWVGTFHGLCNRFLRAHYKEAGLVQTFQILDSQDQLSAIKRLIKTLGIDDEKYPAKQAAYFINNAKENGLRAEVVEANDHYAKKYCEIYAAYQEQCKREGVVDFAELLLLCYEVLSKNTALRLHYQQRFRHILVDEFQDTNTLQYEWLKILAGAGVWAHPELPCASVLAVGDDDQSIYAFRGAKIGNMYDFEREFNVTNRVRLEQNYRSFSHILDCANTLIANNENRLGKTLWTAAGEGDKPRVFEAPTDLDEARFLIEEIGGQMRLGVSAKDIAVLYRSNAQSRVIEHALFKAGIPYKVYGGLRFFERAEIKAALAYLRLMENPHDDGAFLRVVNFPTRGIGLRSIESVQEAARAQDRSLYSSIAFVPGKAGSSLAGFVRLIDQLRFDTLGLPLHELVAHVVHHSGLLAHYQGEKEGTDRVENLNELSNAAVGFTHEEGYALDAPSTVSESGLELPSPLAAFLSHATLEAGENQAQAGQDAVQMMTVHASKGLEFDTVFICGVEEGLFPHENASAEENGVEEERRLMYVAITRARKKLWLSFAAQRLMHGQTRYSLKSRFFDELPDEHLHWLTPKTHGYGTHYATMLQAAWDEPRSGYQQSKFARHDSPHLDTGKADREAAAKIMAKQTSSADHPWRIGQAVRHAKFGQGVVLSLEGRGTEARAQIKFSEVGVKWLALSVARLEPI